MSEGDAVQEVSHGSYEEFLVGEDTLDQIQKIAARCPEGSDASTKLNALTTTVWSRAKAALRQHAQGSTAMTQQEMSNLEANVGSLEQTVAVQREDLQDFQGQMPVVLQAHTPKNRWKRALYLGAMFLGAMLFAGVLVPTLEVLIFIDEATGEPVAGAVWKSGVTGFVIGIVLAVFAWLAAAKNKDINPHNNTAETLMHLLPLFLGLSIAIGIALFRLQQIGFSKVVVGMTVIECAIVGFLEIMARRYAYRYADEPSALAQKIASLTRNIDQNLYTIQNHRERLHGLEGRLTHQRQAEDHWNQLQTGKEGSVRKFMDAWTLQTFELYRPTGGK